MDVYEPMKCNLHYSSNQIVTSMFYSRQAIEHTTRNFIPVNSPLLEGTLPVLTSSTPEFLPLQLTIRNFISIHAFPTLYSIFRTRHFICDQTHGHRSTSVEKLVHGWRLNPGLLRQNRLADW